MRHLTAPPAPDAGASSDVDGAPASSEAATGSRKRARPAGSVPDHAPSKRAHVDAGGGVATASDGALSPLEEQRLLRFYELDIQRACRDAPFDRAIMATAVAFFKRFYLSRRAAELPPSELADAALFLAIKVEACPYTEVDAFRARLARYRAYWRWCWRGEQGGDRLWEWERVRRCKWHTTTNDVLIRRSLSCRERLRV